MSFLIDTNVISEIRKGTRCDAKVAAWYASIDCTASAPMGPNWGGELRRVLVSSQ